MYEMLLPYLSFRFHMPALLQSPGLWKLHRQSHRSAHRSVCRTFQPVHNTFKQSSCHIPVRLPCCKAGIKMNMRLYKWRKHQLSITVYHLFPWLIFQIRSYFCYFSICDLYTFQFFIIFYTCIFNNMFPSPAPFSVYFFLDTANPTK